MVMNLKFLSFPISLCAAFSVVAQNSVTPPASPAPSEEVADTVSLPGYEMLDEVVVKGVKPVMQSDGAKLTYNVDEDPAASSSSAMDMLKKVPMVSVDSEGNIRLNGSEGFRLQLNGLDNPMLKQYAGQVLESMPGSNIVKIEVITEPGAKEDAEGTAGIINIITERTQQKDGYSGTLSLRADNRSLTPSVYTLMKKGKVTLSANVNYQWAFAPQQFEQHLNTTYLTPTDPGSLYTMMGQKTKHQYLGGSLNMSWEPNDNNLFTAGADVFYINGNVSPIYGTTIRYGADGQGLWSFSQDGSGLLHLFNISANASYRHNFGRTGNHLILSYLFNFGRNNLTLDRTYTLTDNFESLLPSERQASLTFDRGHTVQADYSNDFNSERHLLEAGVKGIFRHNTAISSYAYGPDPGNLILFPDEGSDIMQPQNIYAAYATYTGTFSKLNLGAGLRYEHTLLGVSYRPASAADFRNRLNDWVPNAFLAWNFSNSSNLRLGYQMRISRPSIEQVNPFELSFTPFQVNKGNPDLTSERIHIVSLKYSSFGRVIGGSIGVEYNRSDNAISSFTYLQERDGVNTVVTSFANIGKQQSAALNGFATWGITGGMTLVVNGRLAYNMLSAPAEGYRNHGWSGSIGGNWNYTVADVNKFSAYAVWNSRSVTVQGYSSGFYYYGISAARDFLADRSLTLSVSANNFLQSRMSYRSYNAAHDVVYSSVAKNLKAWNVGVSISWKFGSLNAQVKKTGADLNNDDINSASNKGQGGI